MRKLVLPTSIAALLALAACGGSSQDAADGDAAAGLPDLTQGTAKLPLQVEDFPALSSRVCVEVVQFYLEAISSGEFDRAALVWDDPVIDGARLKGLFAGYGEPQFTWNEPFEEGAAGSLYCTINGVLTDAADPAKVPREGTLLLRRVNEVPGATADQLRWTLRSTTFIERMERSGTGDPA